MVPSNSLLFSTIGPHPRLPSNRITSDAINYHCPHPTLGATPIESIEPSEPRYLYIKQILEKEVAALNQTCLKLAHENREQRQEILELQARLGGRAYWAPGGLSSMNNGPQNYPASPAPSLSPSDSISRFDEPRGSPEPSAPPLQKLPLVDQLSIRPSQYPLSILWHVQDCKSEPGLSRSSMERCIRHADGTRIDKREWRAIMDAAGAVINAELRPITLPGATAGLATRARYRQQCPLAWRTAVAKLEAEKPILGLCAGHWKAELTLGQILDNRRSCEARAVRNYEKRSLLRDRRYSS